MLIYLLLFLFFLVCGIQLLRGKFQWLIPEQGKKETKTKLGSQNAERSSKSRAVGLLFLFSGLCILGVGVGSALQQPWISRLIASIMIVVVAVSLILIGTRNKYRS